MNKRIASIALSAALVAALAVMMAGSTAQAGGRLGEPPDCGSHIPCSGDSKTQPQPKSPFVDDECAKHIRCPDGGDGGVDPTPDDGCPIGRPCNYDAPGYQPPGAPDVPPPDDKPGQKVGGSSTKSKTSSKAESDDSVKEAPAPKAVTAQPRTVG